MNHATHSMSPRSEFVPSVGPHLPPDLLAWVAAQMAHGCTTIKLRQRIDDGEVLVSSWHLAGQSPEVLAAEIGFHAHSEGRHLRGPTFFALYAYQDPAREHLARKTMRIEGESFPRSGETEPPNMFGVTSMLMRHAEGATKIALGHTSSIIEHYKELLARAHERIASLEKALERTAEMRESMATLDHERKLVEYKAARDDRQHVFMQEKLDLLFPIVVGRLLKDPISRPLINDEILRQFIASMSGEQWGKVMQALKPEQQAVLGEIYLRYSQTDKNANTAQAAREARAEAYRATAAASAPPTQPASPTPHPSAAPPPPASAAPPATTAPPPKAPPPASASSNTTTAPPTSDTSLPPPDQSQSSRKDNPP